MNITIGSVLKFGKYSGKSVKQVMETDVSYMAWLRENTDHALTLDLHAAIDDWIKRDRRNAGRFKTSNRLIAEGKYRLTDGDKTFSDEEISVINHKSMDHSAMYAGEWGSF